MKNIFAYTPPGSMPPYVSLNEMNGAEDGGAVVLTVRGINGKSASITLPPAELTKLAQSILAYDAARLLST